MDFYCKVCNVECKNNENYFSHVTGMKHRKKLKPIAPEVIEIDMNSDFEDDNDLPTQEPSQTVSKSLPMSPAPKSHVQVVANQSTRPKLAVPNQLALPKPSVPNQCSQVPYHSKTKVSTILPVVNSSVVIANHPMAQVTTNRSIVINHPAVTNRPLPQVTVSRSVSPSATIPLRKFPCNLCGLELDSAFNLQQHRGSKRCTVSDTSKGALPQHICNTCGLELDTAFNLQQHRGSKRCTVSDTSKGALPQQICNACGQEFDNTTNLERHIASKKCRSAPPSSYSHSSTSLHSSAAPQSVARQFHCGQCEKEFPNLPKLAHHRKHCHPDSIPNLQQSCNDFICTTCIIEPVESAIKGVYRSIDIKPTATCLTLPQLLIATEKAINHILKHCLENGEKIKVFTTISVIMQKINASDGKIDREDHSHFSSKAIPIQTEEDIREFIENVNKLEKHIEKYTSNGSNWVVAGIEKIAIRLVKYKVLNGATSTFELPEELAVKKCVLNIESKDNECVKYAIIASLHHKEVDDGNRNNNRFNKYMEFEKHYSFSMMKYPATVEDLVTFQKDNKEVAINALLYVEGTKKSSATVVPIYHPPHSIVLGRRIANILLVKDHWLPITNLDRLLSTGHNNNAHCYRCLRNFYHPERLEKHMTKCYNSTGQKETMPASDKAYKKFDDWSKMLSPPFVMYADIEALLIPSDTSLQKHVPWVVGSYLVAHQDLNYQPQRVQFHQGKDCVEEFCQYLDEKVHQIYKYNRVHCNKPQDRTNSLDHRIFELAKECEYCKISFKFVKKVWHHCHISGKFIAAICQQCNTKIRQPIATMPVLFHNLKNYDMHALCLGGFSKMSGWHLKPIAQTKEKYMTLVARVEVDRDEKGKSIYFNLRFVDSFQFLTTSLDRLVSSLNRDNMQHTQSLRQRFCQVDDDVIFGKGVFPYSYLDHEDKLKHSYLPPLSFFHDTLTNSLRTTPEDYTRAERAFKQFDCYSLNDYLLRYLELDCLLLADVFENFRATAIHNYQLDPANFITLPQFTFAAAFRMTEVDLLTDAEMYELFEQGIRGGMCFVNKHYVKANQDTAIAYWDENNLYANALAQLLPCGQFKWLERDEIEAIDWVNVDTEGEYGYTIKCDLEYPASIHDKTEDFPLAPMSQMVTEEMLTPLMKKLWSKRCELRGQSVKYKAEKKLLMTCSDKIEYVVHFKLLQFYLKMGMRIINIHSVVKYKQASIFKAYIDANSYRRQAAKDTFTKDLYKLINNALFGKTMEGVRGRKEFHLVNTEEKMLVDSSKPHFLRAYAFNEDLVLTEMMKLEVLLDKPIFIGQAVLDLSKLIMYQLRYEKLTAYEERFGGKIKVIGSDTDSLFCCISNIDLHNELHPAMVHDGLLDTSNYPTEHQLFSEQFKAKLGCIKDEVEGEQLLEAVLLKPKCYSMITASGRACKKTAKGIQYCVRQALRHEEYLKVYQQQEEISKNVRRFQSDKHVIHTIQQTKWALSATDNKRAWISVNESLPYGHYSLEPPAKRARL